MGRGMAPSAYVLGIQALPSLFSNDSLIQVATVHTLLNDVVLYATAAVKSDVLASGKEERLCSKCVGIETCYVLVNGHSMHQSDVYSVLRTPYTILRDTQSHHKLLFLAHLDLRNGAGEQGSRGAGEQLSKGLGTPNNTCIWVCYTYSVPCTLLHYYIASTEYILRSTSVRDYRLLQVPT
jgi:hypothetical protein